MSFGPNPWQQTQWDWRAAGNFMGGGAGAGLIVFGVLANTPAAWLVLLTGAALVGAGLFCVLLEIGRPLRALRVFVNPRSSWMSREAIAATLLMPATLAAAIGLPGTRWLAAALALTFVYCQSRIVHAAKGIPAWREPLVVPLIVLTGLTEGAGLTLLLQPAQAFNDSRLLALACVLALARLWVSWAYRRRLVKRASAALDAPIRWMQIADVAAVLLLLALAATGTASSPLIAGLGLLLSATGAGLKFALITRAGFNQGFALAHLPVRGVRR
jgi:phenylacetyl-CoA:acceptor oxidoreductase subunit 2